MTRYLRAARWRFLDRPGTTEVLLRKTWWGWILEGEATTPVGGEPIRLTFKVRCDSRWRTRRATIRLDDGESSRSLRIRRSRDGLWTVDRRPREDLRGCEDLDLEATPATNTLPIRRLRLGIGEAADVRAAWVRFPPLTVEPTKQRYTRVGATRYRYENLDSGYATEFNVDEAGLVLRYAGLWERAP